MSNSEFIVDDNELRGDAIGSTLYSERWVLKLMMQLFKLSVGDASLDTDLETDLCTLWDMTTEVDVVLFMKEHGILDLILQNLQRTGEGRLTEILVGMLANMCAVKAFREEYGERADFLNIMMNLLECRDTLTLVQVIRVINYFAHHISCSSEAESVNEDAVDNMEREQEETCEDSQDDAQEGSREGAVVEDQEDERELDDEGNQGSEQDREDECKTDSEIIDEDFLDNRPGKSVNDKDNVTCNNIQQPENNRQNTSGPHLEQNARNPEYRTCAIDFRVNISNESHSQGQYQQVNVSFSEIPEHVSNRNSTGGGPAGRMSGQNSCVSSKPSSLLTNLTVQVNQNTMEFSQWCTIGTKAQPPDRNLNTVRNLSSSACRSSGETSVPGNVRNGSSVENAARSPSCLAAQHSTDTNMDTRYIPVASCSREVPNNDSAQLKISMKNATSPSCVIHGHVNKHNQLPKSSSSLEEGHEPKCMGQKTSDSSKQPAEYAPRSPSYTPPQLSEDTNIHTINTPVASCSKHGPKISKNTALPSCDKHCHSDSGNQLPKSSSSVEERHEPIWVGRKTSDCSKQPAECSPRSPASTPPQLSKDNNMHTINTPVASCSKDVPELGSQRPSRITDENRTEVYFGSCALWYDAFIKFRTWLPHLAFIMFSSKNLELLEMSWTLLNTLCYIPIKDSMLSSIIASPNAIRCFFESIDECIRQSNITQDVFSNKVPKLKKFFTIWMEILYSFSLQPASSTVLNVCKSPLIILINFTMRHTHILQPLDSDAFTTLERMICILREVSFTPPYEFELLIEGIPSVLAIRSLMQDETYGQEHLEESCHALQVVAYINDFLKSVVMWIDTLPAADKSISVKNMKISILKKLK